MKKSIAPLVSACKKYEEDLVLYYYGECIATERVQVAEHLSGCPRCSAFVDDLARVLPHMAPTDELPQSFWDNYLRETVAKLAEQEERKSWWRNLLAPLNGWLVPALGTAAVAIFAVVMVLGKGNLNLLTDSAPSNIPQEVLADANQLEFFRSLELLESLDKLEEADTKKLEGASSQLHRLNLPKEIV